MNQVNTEDKNIWSIELGKSAEQLVEHQKNAAEVIILKSGLKTGNVLKGETWQEPQGHCGNFGLISKTYEQK